MNYKQAPGFSAVSVANGSILVVIVAMAISVAIDFLPTQAKSAAAATNAPTSHNTSPV